MPIPVHDGVTPWRNDQELSKVRGQLFSGKREGEPDEREEACKLVTVWRIRGHLPHVGLFGDAIFIQVSVDVNGTCHGTSPGVINAVDATALLTEAVLVDEKNTMTNVAMRLLYVGAFCRFVTGLVDTGQGKLRGGPRHGQRIRKLSMFERAKQLRLPASFVDIRHQATHQQLPSIPALRQAVKKALDWVWNDFWIDQCLPSTRSISQISDVPHLRYEVEQYYEFAVAERKRHSQPMLNDKATEICRDLVRICKSGEEVLTELAIIMIEWGFMVPDTGRDDLHEQIDESLLLWDPLIIKLCSHQLPFLKALTDQMSIQLALPSGPMDISIDRYREVITMWLEHIFATKHYVPTIKRAKYDINHILSTCVNCQNYWTVQLARRIMTAPGYEATKKNYRARVENAIPHLAAGPNPSILYRTVSGTQDGTEEKFSKDKVAQEIKVVKEDLYVGPWQSVNKNIWRPTLFGIIH